MNKQIPRSSNKTKPSIYTSKTILRLTKHKSFLLTKLHYIQRHNDSQRYKPQIEKIKSLIKDTRLKINSLVNIKTENHWEKTLGKIDHKQPEKFFPIINKIFRPKSFTEPPKLSITIKEVRSLENSKVDLKKYSLVDNQYDITEMTDKTNILGAYFEHINSPKQLNTSSCLKGIIDNEIANDKQDFDQRYSHPTTQFTRTNKATWPSHEANEQKYFCTTAEVTNIVKKLPNKTSTGLDMIPAIVLKHLPQIYIRNYTILFNNALNLKYFPEGWKNAKIVPVLKKGKDPTKPSSYCPISLTPNISKVYEAIINNRVIDHCNKNAIIPNNQYGFRAKYSTTHAINKLLSDTFTYLNNGKIVGATLIDLEKAFNSVWINGLIFKLKRKNMNINLIHTIWDMITGREFQVSLGNESSNTFKIEEGLPQGMVNSPYPFNIFTSDINNAYHLNTGNNSHSIAFADNLIIYVADTTTERVHKKLNPIINNIYNMYNTWNLKVNPDKSETIVFSRPARFITKSKRSNAKDFAITIKTLHNEKITHIPTKNTVKYLGVYMDKLLKCNPHIETQLKKARNTYKALHHLFYNKHLTSKVKTLY